MSHINALMNINGIPYLLGEYLDHACWQNLNEYDVENNIVVDTTENMRAIIDVSLRDIPTNRDGSMFLTGNSSLNKVLLAKINKFYNEYCGKLDTVKNYLKVKVNYQLEDVRTSKIIRSTVEEFRLNNKAYFQKVNVNNVDDNYIISNYYGTEPSAISQFTHGRERMLLRITNIELCYECVKPSVSMPKNGHMRRFADDMEFPMNPDNTYMYNYHRHAQSSQYFPDDGLNRQGADIAKYDIPKWAMTTAYYHFEDEGNLLVLHEQEIHDRKNKLLELPCGVINVNRSFYIQPGHQLIFKFSIWKNDTAIIYKPLNLAKALHVPFTEYGDQYYHNHHGNNHNDDLIYRMLDDRKDMDNRQNDAINKLNNMIINNIYPILRKLDSELEDDDLDNIHDLPTDNYQHHSHHHDHSRRDRIRKLYETIKSLSDELEELKNNNDNYQEITDEQLEDIINNAFDSTRPDNDSESTDIDG